MGRTLAHFDGQTGKNHIVLARILSDKKLVIHYRTIEISPWKPLPETPGPASVLSKRIRVRAKCTRRSRQARRLTDKDTIVLGDFANSTGDSVFDGTRKCYESVLLCPNIAAIVGNIQAFVFPEFAVCNGLRCRTVCLPGSGAACARETAGG